MILSMTGYGDAEASHDGLSYAVEIRSVNHRYFKAMIKLPERLQPLEPQVDKLLRSRLGRGSINYQLRTRTAANSCMNQINTELLKRYVQELTEAVRSDALQLDLSGLMVLPGVCGPTAEENVDREKVWTVVSELTEVALQKLLLMRRQEGQAIARDLLQHTRAIAQQSAEVAQRAPGVVRDYRDRLTQRVNELLADSNLELAQDELTREIAVFAERCDISEEIARLSSHLEQFVCLVQSNEHAGRKLEFMAQEMLREANTIGSKANDGRIARHVVEMKGLIDRLKEQVQNVE